MTDMRDPIPFKPKVWHKHGPLGQIRAMADWIAREARSETPNREMLGKIERNLRCAADTMTDPVESVLHDATIIEHDNETGLVVRTTGGQVYGLALNHEGGRDVLGVTELDPNAS